MYTCTYREYSRYSRMRFTMRQANLMEVMDADIADALKSHESRQLASCRPKKGETAEDFKHGCLKGTVA